MGRDVEAELVLTLEEVLAGGPKKVTLNGSSGVRSLSVNIPSGIREGAKLRLAGQMCIRDSTVTFIQKMLFSATSMRLPSGEPPSGTM